MTKFSALVDSTIPFLQKTPDNALCSELVAMYQMINADSIFKRDAIALKANLVKALQAKIDEFEEYSPGVRALFERYSEGKVTYNAKHPLALKKQRKSARGIEVQNELDHQINALETATKWLKNDTINAKKERQLSKDPAEQKELDKKIKKLDQEFEALETYQGLLDALQRVKALSKYTLEREKYKKQIILATYQFLTMVPAEDTATEKRLRKALGFLLKKTGLTLDSKAPDLDYINKEMKKRGYLVPHDEGVAYTVNRAQKQISEGYQRALGDPNRKLSLPAYRETLYAINDEQTKLPFPGELDSTAINAIKRYNKKRENDTVGIYAQTQHIFLDFMNLPKSFAIANKVLGIKTSLGRLLHPTQWGQPDLQSVVYDIASIFNAIGKREYLGQVTGFFFPHDNLGPAQKRQKLEDFLQFLIEQFNIIQDTPLKDIDEEKRAALLRQFKVLINRYSELAHLSQRLTVVKETYRDKEIETYQATPQQPLTYKKRNARARKAALKVVSTVLTAFVTVGQAVLTYYAVLSLAALAIFAPFVPILVPICVFATLYTNFILFGGDTWDALKQFVYKGDIFNGRKTIGGKAAMGVALMAGVLMALTMGGMIFFSAASAFGLAAVATTVGPIAALLGAPALAITAIALGVGTAVCFAAVMYKAVAKLFGSIGDGHTQFVNARKKNGGSTLTTIEVALKKLFEEKLRNPVRVPDPLNPEETVRDDTATEQAIRRARIDFVVGGTIKTVLYGLGAFLCLGATFATFNIWHTEIAAGLQLWTGMTATIAATAVSVASGVGFVLSFLSGLPNAVFVARGFKTLADYGTRISKDYFATPIVNTTVNTVVRFFTEGPMALAKDAKKGAEHYFSATKKFAVALRKDPQRTITPLVEKAILFTLDLPTVLMNGFANFALALKSFVLVDGQSVPLTGSGFTQSVALMAQSVGVNWVAMSGRSGALSDVKPVHQGGKVSRASALPPALPNVANNVPNGDANADLGLPPLEAPVEAAPAGRRAVRRKETHTYKSEKIYSRKDQLMATFYKVIDGTKTPRSQTAGCDSHEFQKTVAETGRELLTSTTSMSAAAA